MSDIGNSELVCICGSRSISVDVDNQSGAAFIECCGCMRVVGGCSESEAIKMWNGAMSVFYPDPLSQALNEGDGIYRP